MHPAPSVILFSVLSGAGFGILAALALGHPALTGWPAFAAWALGYGLAGAGLLASTFHLGRPERALRAFTQWRSSWLSREAWAAVAALFALAPVALSDWLDLGLPRALAVPGAVLALVTVVCTAMIYTQLRTVPRWNHWGTPVLFLGFAATAAMVLAAPWPWAVASLLALGGVLAWSFVRGDRAFAAAGHDLGTATGLDRLGKAAVFDPAHTAGNYLQSEMIHIVGRRHAAKLRRIALGLAAVAPALVLLILPDPAARGLALGLHLAGALAARWLFFAEAEHVVGLYYGKR